MSAAAISLADAERLDSADPLRSLRDLFALPAGTIYLDGHSLGALPAITAARLAAVVADEWGTGLIGSWNEAGWFTLPTDLGDTLAPLIGAGPGEVAVTDATSVNLYKVLHAAMQTADPERSIIVAEREAFPTNLYIAASAARQHQADLRLVDRADIHEALSHHVGAVLLSEVDSRTGDRLDMGELTAAAHHEGIVAVWDLCHSAGAVPVDLHAAGADYAVGCTYKYLCGGPGSPSFVWAHPRHAGRAHQPLTGWWSHAAPFDMTPDYRPAERAASWLTGTQPVLALAAMGCGLATVLAGAPGGDMAAIRAKSVALTELFIALVDDRLGDAVEVVTPRESDRRGSHVSLAHPDAYGVVQALIARGVVGDVRVGANGAPDLARFGIAPMYVGYADVWRAVDQLAAVLAADEHRRPAHATRRPVT